MILLDPVWTLQRLAAHDGGPRHDLYIAVGESIRREYDDDPTNHPCSGSLEAIEKALKSIMHAVAGDEARDEVVKFLDAFRDKIHIQCP